MSLQRSRAFSPGRKKGRCRMKKMLAAILAMAMILAVTVNVLAEEEGLLKNYLQRIADPEDAIAYTISMADDGPLEPGDVDPEVYVSNLLQMTLTPADLSETPEGEYVVLTFPSDEISFDFFQAEDGKNLIRQVDKDGTETLFRATMPADLAQPTDIMTSWYFSIADAHGLVPAVEANLPESGWVLETLEKVDWISDRATLEVFLEDTDNYKVLITWGSSATESGEWTFACDYDPASQALFARYVIHDNLTFNDKGEEIGRENVYEMESKAVFIVNDQSHLVILNAGDEALEKKVFEKVEREAGSETSGMAGWTVPETTEVTAELRDAFDNALKGLLGVSYEPVAFLAEKDGVRCFLAKATVIYPGATPYYVLIYLKEDGVQNIWDLWLDAHANP